MGKYFIILDIFTIRGFPIICQTIGNPLLAENLIILRYIMYVFFFFI
jgi:hypothetical protein